MTDLSGLTEEERRVYTHLRDKAFQYSADPAWESAANCIDRLLSERAKLVEALKPFAEACDGFAWPVYETDKNFVSPELALTVGDLRKARAVLTPEHSALKGETNE